MSKVTKWTFPDCVGIGVSLHGGEGGGWRTNAERTYQCQRDCEKEPECNHWMQTMYNTRHCHMFKSYSATLSTNRHHFFSGSKHCKIENPFEENCHEFGTYIVGDVTPVGNANNVKDCKQFCTNRLECNYWSYEFISKECHLRDAEITSKSHYRRANSFISGTKNCEELQSCAIRGKTWDLPVGETHPNFDPATCRRECLKNKEWCKYFTWDRAAGRTCTLFDGWQILPIDTDPYEPVLSGEVGCRLPNRYQACAELDVALNDGNERTQCGR